MPGAPRSGNGETHWYTWSAIRASACLPPWLGCIGRSAGGGSYVAGASDPVEEWNTLTKLYRAWHPEHSFCTLFSAVQVACVPASHLLHPL